MRRVLAVLAIPGFFAGLYYFVASFFGFRTDPLTAQGILLHVGVFLLGIPLVAIEQRAKNAPIFSGQPRWAVRITQVLGLLCMVAFFVFLALSHAASPEIVDGEYVLRSHGGIVEHISEHDYFMLKGWQLRLFASGWMFFYFSIGIGWWFPKRDETPWTVTMPD